MAIQLLGRFSIAIDGVPIPGDAWRSRRAADVVKLLALAPNHRLHRSQVMEALWPESDPQASGTNLRKALHFARHALGDEHAIATEHGVLALWPDAQVNTDVERFETAAQRALDAADYAACQAAADLYCDDLLPDDCYESWLAEPRGRLRQRYLNVLRAGALWERLIEEDPDRRAGGTRADACSSRRRRTPRSHPSLRTAARGPPGSAGRRAGPRNGRAL